MQLLDDFLADMRKVRPSGAISPLQQDVTAMGRSINPQGNPKAVQLPAMGADRLGMPSGYGEEGTTEREQASIAPTSSVGGQMPNYSFPAYPDFTYPSLPEHTRYPALPGVSPIPDLPPRRNLGDYPPYPEIPSYKPSLAQDISSYGGISKAGLSVVSEGARLYNTSAANRSGANPISGTIDTAMKVINPALAAFNIHNLWQSDLSKAEKIRGTVSQGIQPTSQLLYDAGKGLESAGLINAGGWTTAVSGSIADSAPYVNLALSGYDLATAKNMNSAGRPAYNTAMAAMSIANPYFGVVNAVGQAAFGGIQMYKRSRDDRQFETPQMTDSRIRAGIKYALDYGGRVEKADVLKAFMSMGITKEQAEKYYNEGNFYAPTEVWNDGTWSGRWNDWRVNKQLLEQFGDMSGVEGGATFKDVIENKVGIKPLTPDEYEDVIGDQYYDMVSGGYVTGPTSYRNKRTGDIVPNKPNYDFSWGYDYGDPFAITDVGT